MDVTPVSIKPHRAAPPICWGRGGKGPAVGGGPIEKQIWEQILQTEACSRLRQVFAYLVVEFQTKKNHLNQVVIWSSIIQRVDDANLVSMDEQIAYPYMLTDQGDCFDISS